jgi:hypothetical protein
MEEGQIARLLCSEWKLFLSTSQIRFLGLSNSLCNSPVNLFWGLRNYFNTCFIHLSPFVFFLSFLLRMLLVKFYTVIQLEIFNIYLLCSFRCLANISLHKHVLSLRIKILCVRIERGIHSRVSCDQNKCCYWKAAVSSSVANFTSDVRELLRDSCDGYPFFHYDFLTRGREFTIAR